MANKTTYWKQLIVVILFLLVFISSAATLRCWQHKRTAHTAYPKTNKDPNDLDRIVTLAESLARTNKNSEMQIAEKLLRTAIAAAPDHVEAMTLLAMLLQATGQYAEAACLYEEIIIIEPDAKLAINNLAWIMCEKLGQYRQSHELAERALLKNCDCADFLDTLGLAHYRLGLYEEAVQDFTRSVELSPPQSPAEVLSLFHLAQARIAMGLHTEAIQALQQIVKSGPDARNVYGTEISLIESILRQLKNNNNYAAATN